MFTAKRTTEADGGDFLARRTAAVRTRSEGGGSVYCAHAQSRKKNFLQWLANVYSSITQSQSFMALSINAPSRSFARLTGHY